MQSVTKGISTIFHLYQNFMPYHSEYSESLFTTFYCKKCDDAFIIACQQKKDNCKILFNDNKYKDIIDMRSCREWIRSMTFFLNKRNGCIINFYGWYTSIRQSGQHRKCLTGWIIILLNKKLFFYFYCKYIHEKL